MRIELQALDRGTLMNLRCADAALAHLLRVTGCTDLLDVPESDGTVFHASCHDSLLVYLVDPVECCELRWTLRGSEQR